MTRVIAAIDNSDAMHPVLAAAEIVALVYEGDIDVIHVNAKDSGELEAMAGRHVRFIPGEVSQVIVDEIAPEDVLIAVMGSREHAHADGSAGHVALDVATRIEKPLVLVPPEWPPLGPKDHLRLLVPLDGTEETSITVEALVARIARSDAEIIALHVFDDASTPLFLDRPEHDLPLWGQEFLARHCAQPGSLLQWKTGPVGAGIADTAESEDVDAVVLGWHGVLSPGRAAAVREVLARAKVPVVLVPRIAAERALALNAAQHEHDPVRAR
jgi:nucleotide-binding universal stress UspA family protein